MQYVPLGLSGLTVSRMGLGLAALGRPGYMTLGHAQDLARDYSVDAMCARAHAVLDEALASGITYVDAARSYGRAEEFLGSWLAAPGRARVVVGSKWGYAYTAAWRVDAPMHEHKEHSLERFEQQLEETRANLGAHLSLYQIHSVGTDAGVFSDARVLRRLARLREQGVRIGLSVTGPEQDSIVRRALEVRLEGVGLFQTVQATWNVLEPSSGPALTAAAAAGLGVIIKEPLANGRLTDKNRESDFVSRLDTLRVLAARHHTSIDAIALAAALAQPFAHVVLSGAATVEHLRSNLAALELRLDARDLALLSALDEGGGAYWARRAALRWG